MGPAKKTFPGLDSLRAYSVLSFLEDSMGSLDIAGVTCRRSSRFRVGFGIDILNLVTAPERNDCGQAATVFRYWLPPVVCRGGGGS